MDQWRIEEKRFLVIKTSPGSFSVENLGNGELYVRYGALGGSGSRTETTKEVSKRLSGRINTHHEAQKMLALLTELGWQEVIAEFNQEAVKVQKIEDEKYFHNLEQYINETQPIWEQYKDYDYNDWYKCIADELEQSPDYNPEEVSVRRLHYRAQNLLKSMKDFPDRKEHYMCLRQKRVLVDDQ